MVLAHDFNEGRRTSDIQISVDVTFDSMLLSDATLSGLKSSGFHKPSPIQLHGIPLGKCGFDLFLEAKSGTGKTAVFTVIALENLDINKGLQVVILAPTREIAAQVSDVIKQVGSSYEGLKVEVVMGGLPLEDDIKRLKNNVHILVGSPGRMRHLIHDKHVQISGVRMFVLDEADKLMDKSFQADINYIFSALPKEKQVIMSSATYPDTLKDVMQNYVQKAQHICPDSNSVLLGIKQLVTIVSSNVNIVRQTHYKFKELLRILSKQEFKQCLIFCNYQGRVTELCKMLLREKWPAEQLHGSLEQNDRLDALKTLQDYKCRILVSTDIASRGIDASNVDLIINFEPPSTWPTYLHRIGRAGRFGSYGSAITILSKGEIKNFRQLIKSINVKINIISLWDNAVFDLSDSEENNVNSVNLMKTPEQIEASDLTVISDVSQDEATSEATEDDDQDLENYKELLDELSNMEKKRLTNVNYSSRKSKANKIETFNDLMASFKDHTNNNDKSQEMTEKKYFDAQLYESEPEIVPVSNAEVNLGIENKDEEDIASNITVEKHNEEYNVNEFRVVNHSEDNIGSNLTVKKQNEGNIVNNILAEKKNEEDKVNELRIEKGNGEDMEKELRVEKLNKDEVNLSVHNRQNNKDSCENHIKQNVNILYNSNTDASLENKDCYADFDASCSQALRDAGLPTCFGSTKYAKKTIRNEYKQSKLQSHKGDKEYVNNQNNVRSKQVKNKLVETPLYSSSSEASDYDDDIPLCLSTGSTDELLENKGFQNRYNNIKVCNNYSDNSYNTKNVNYKKYRNWYRNLKSHIKQVEMALYIEELS